MNVAVLTMFNGLSSTYSLVNVVADQLSMLLRAGCSVKLLVSESCPDGERSGIFLDPRIQWVKIVNTRNGQPIHWHDYSGADGTVHDSFYEEAQLIAKDYVTHLQDVDVCILHDILYQGWHLVLNEAVPALKELGQALGAYFMRWDARNFGFDTKETYHPSEQAYYQEHGERIVNLMREDRSLSSKPLIRTKYNPDWICQNQLMPLLEG